MIPYHRLTTYLPCQIDGVAGLKYVGAGVVVDAKLGLVLVDRNTVPVGLGDVRVEFASTVDVEATVRFLHPTHNFALVQYRTEQLDGSEPSDASEGGAGCGGGVGGEGESEAAAMLRYCGVVAAAISADPLEVGEECTFVGLPKQDAALPFFQDCVVREA